MAKYAPGDKVVNNATNEKGVIIAVCPMNRGRQRYRIKYDDGSENFEFSERLDPDEVIRDPFERWRHNMYGHYTEYLKGNTAFKISSANNSTISSLKASKTIFRPYQFYPLLKFLNSPNRRLLIADEVGLGKTIEAGHIMLELKARNELRNALVICPMALRSKWATELREKFGLDFVEIEDKKQLLHELKAHNGTFRAVVNYDKIKEDSEFLTYIEEKEIVFSIIVCDESHRLRNKGTQKYDGIRKLFPHVKGAVFMSATPIMLNQGNLYSQLHLLDPDVYPDDDEIKKEIDKEYLETFENSLQLNTPFIRAISAINRDVPLPVVARDLSSSEVTTYINIGEYKIPTVNKIGEYFADYPIYQQIMADLASKDNSHSLKARLLHNLSEMSPMNGIFSRTRKRDVTQDWSQAERDPSKVEVKLSAEEKREYDEIIDKYIDDHTTYDEYGRVQTGTFGLITVKRQLASSIWAYKCKNADDLVELEKAAAHQDSKFEALLHKLNLVFSHGDKKIIIFAIFKKTLWYLSYRLKKLGYNNVVIHGGGKISKEDALYQFQHDDSIQILLSSEVGSEGLDMQFCNSLVNYDLPWNPMVVEQRIGRIDRMGQKSPKVHIYNMVVIDSILERIYSRLLERIGIFRESIGDLEAILNSEIDFNGESVTIRKACELVNNDFYSNKLTDEEIEKKSREIAQAIENERLNLKKIEEGITDSLTADSYFKNEVRRIEENNSYVTSNELYYFVLQMIKEELTTCELRETETPEIYELHIPPSSPNTLINFLHKYLPVDRDDQHVFTEYINSIRDELDLKLTFNQDVAFNDKTISFINLYHPIVQAGVKMFAARRDPSQCTFFFALSSSSLPSSIKKHKYILAVCKITVKRVLFDKPVVMDSLYPILYDLEEKKIISDQNLAETFMGRAQVDGSYANLEDDFRIESAVIDDLIYDFGDYMDKYKGEYKKDLELRIDNNKRMRAEQTRRSFESREQKIKDAIEKQATIRAYAIFNKDVVAQRNAEGALRLMNSNLTAARRSFESDLERINADEQLKVYGEFMSINLVQVI